jgi:hypothetical protein
VAFNTGSQSWEKFESGNSPVFSSKKGTYKVADGSNLEMWAGAKRAGVIYSFDPGTVTEGRTGQGLSDQAGDGFSWKCIGIAQV